jgi:uridylate kinase
LGVDARVLSAVEMETFTETYIREKAVSHLKHGRVVIFACGIGSPYFSTDTAAVLRAKEIDAEIVLLAKNIDAVYDADPNKCEGARRFKSIKYFDVLEKGLQVMDTTAITFCMDNAIPLIVFGLNCEGNIMRVLHGEDVGTVISKEIETEYR